MLQIKNSHTVLSAYKLFTIVFLFFIFMPNYLSAQEATGGDEVYELAIGGKNYRVHAFKTVGNHQLIINQNLVIDVLVVAGGGGGSAGYCGGGGAGGLIYRAQQSYSSGQTINLSVGSGGLGSTDASLRGNQGSNSSFEVYSAIGGGGGSGYYTGGGNGGSGGGGCYSSSFGLGTTGQGNQGGTGTSSGNHGSGGGGGAGALGQNGSSTKGGDGGVGLDFSHIFGSSIGHNGWFSGGGAGGTYLGGVRGSGGLGGGGNGITDTAGHGLPNTGGGGAGGNMVSGGYSSPSGNGGSGIVIVRYEISQFNLNINNGNQDLTPTKSSPNFTVSGTVEYPEDGDATSVEVSASIGGINRSVVVPVSTNMNWQLSWSYNELTEGEYTDIEFTATSNSSTPEETTSTYTGKIIIDKTAPTCGNWSPAVSSWKISGGETFTLTGSSDIGGSGLATSSASVSCSTGPLHGNTCPVTIFDNAGNDKICPSPINRVDIFTPTLSVTPAIIGWQGDKQDIIVLSEDNETSISRIAYAWDLNTLGNDCSGGTTISSGDNLRLTISGGANPLYICSIDLAGNVSNLTDIYQYIPPVFTNPHLQKQVTLPNLYWNIESISETQSYVEVKGFFPKTTGNYHYALEYIIPTISKSYTQALRTSPFTETHFTILIPTADFNASKDNHTFSGPQKLKITDLDQMEATTIDHNLSFFFPIHQSNHRKDFNYFILASDNRMNEVEE